MLHRRPYLNTVFNSGQYILAVLAAGAVFVAVEPHATSLRVPLFAGRLDPTFWAAFLAAILAHVITSSLFVSRFIARRAGAPVLAVFRVNIAWEVVNSLALAVLGLILALVYLRALPVEAVALAVPLALVGYMLMLYTTRERAHRELEIVERIGRAAIQLNPAELYEAMYQQIRRVMSVDAFYVATHDPEADRMTFEFLVDSKERFPRQAYDRSHALREILERRQPVLIHRAPDEMARPDGFERVGREERRSASLMLVPVLNGDRVTGVVSAQSYTFFAYTDRDLRLLETIAGQVAVAIENARLLEASRRSVERLTTLQRLSTAIAGTLEMERLMPAIVEGARQTLDVDRCAIYLRNGPGGAIEVYAHGFPPEFAPAMRQALGGPLPPLLLDFSRPQIIDDVQMHPVALAVRESLYRGEATPLQAIMGGVRTVAMIPLSYLDEQIGALGFYHDRVRPYTADDVALAQAIASQAAIAVKNATLFAQTQRRAAEVDLLNRLMSTVTGTLDLDELFPHVTEQVAASFGYSHVSIYRRDGDGLVLQAQVGYTQAPERISISQGIMGRAARTGQPLLVGDVRSDPDYIAADPAIKSKAAVPIVSEDQVIGVLNVEAEADRILTQGDLTLLQTLSRQLSVALRNATLYADATQARHELSVLYEAAKAVSTSLELATVLDTLVQVPCRAFGYEYGAILLTDDRSGGLIVEATYGYEPGTRGYRIPAGKGISGWVQRVGKPVFVPDVKQDPRYLCVDDRVVAEIAVPLVSEGQVIGVFNVETTRPDGLAEHDLTILSALAGYATIAIRNARLFEQTKHLAITDGLTGLYNHRYLHEALERQLERCNGEGQPLALIMLEIDKFKCYNDTYGHQRGDEVLRIVADLLRRHCRVTDLVARYGGDEFMIGLANTPKEAACGVAERLRRAVETYLFLLGENIATSVTLSAGVAASPEDGETVDALIDAVDDAQYTAKQSGGNKVQVAQVYR